MLHDMTERITLYRCVACGHVTTNGSIHGCVLCLTGREPESFEVIPAPDEQAVERAATYLCSISFSLLPNYGGDRKDIARGVLAAALDQPE